MKTKNATLRLLVAGVVLIGSIQKTNAQSFLTAFERPGEFYSGLYGYQLPDSSYGIFCQTRGLTSVFGLHFVGLDSRGRLLSERFSEIPNNFEYRYMNSEDVCSDFNGNLYFSYGVESTLDSVPYGFAKFNPNGVLEWYDHVPRHQTCPLASGNLISYVGDTAGNHFEIFTSQNTRVKLSKQLPIHYYYQIAQADDNTFVFCDFKNDSFVLYKIDTNGNVFLQKQFLVYPIGSGLATQFKQRYAGKIQLFERDGFLYFSHCRYLPAINYYQPYLSKMDKDFNMVWEKPIADTLQALSSFKFAPIGKNGFLVAYVPGPPAGTIPNPYASKEGISFSYLDSLGNIYENKTLSTNIHGWSINDSIGSYTWFDVVNINPTLDHGLMIVCNINFEPIVSKANFVIIKTDSMGLITNTPPPPYTAIQRVEQRQVRMYPNPAQNSVFFDSDLPIDKLTIYDLNGQLIRENGGDSQMELADVPSGLYIVKIDVSGSFLFKKLSLVH